MIGTTTIDFESALLRASGRASLDVFGLLTGSARFTLDQRTVDVDLDGDPATAGDQLDDAQLTAFALTEIDLKLGTDTVGLRIGPGGTIGVASLAKHRRSPLVGRRHRLEPEHQPDRSRHRRLGGQRRDLDQPGDRRRRRWTGPPPTARR